MYNNLSIPMVLYTPTQEVGVSKYTSFGDVNQSKLKALINSSFAEQGKELATNYFDTTKPSAVYVAGDFYAAGTIIRDLGRNLGDTVYICKFFVDPSLQGNGLGRDLLEHILHDIGIKPENHDGKSVILRTDVKNIKANKLYNGVFSEEYSGSSHHVKSTDGKHEWFVHQIGLQGEGLERKIRVVADLPITMIPVN